MKRRTTLGTWGVAALLCGGLLWLTAQQGAAQLTSPLNSSTSTLNSTISPLTSTTSSLIPRLSLSGLNITSGDWDRSVGALTLTNLGGSMVIIDSILVVMDFVGSSGASATCRGVSSFPSVAPGTTIPVGGSLTIGVRSVCTEVTPPVDTHEVVTIVMFTLVGSDTVFTSSGVFHL